MKSLHEWFPEREHLPKVWEVEGGEDLLFIICKEQDFSLEEGETIYAVRKTVLEEDFGLRYATRNSPKTV